MRRIAGKLVRLVVVLFLVTFGTFMLIRIFPGDPVKKMIPFGTNLQAQRAQLRKEIGLDKPALQQYGSWLGGLATGDFGKVYPSRTPVSEVLADAAPVTLLLIFYSQLLALLVAVPLGVFTAYRAGTWIDRIASTSAFGLLSIPSFVLGLYLAYFVGARLQWLPAGQYVPFSTDPVQHFRSMALPTISLAAGEITLYMRLLRSDMIATLQESFVKTARSKGLTSRRILWRHAFRPSSLTLLTFAGLNLGTLVGSAVVIETVFSLPGLGTEIYKAIIGQQYLALQSYVALIAVGYVLINFGVDFLYTVLDPRIRHGRATSLSAELDQSEADAEATVEAEAAAVTESELAAVGWAARRGRRGLGVGGWMAIGWMVFLVICSVLAPVLPFADPAASNPSIARQAPSTAAFLGGDSNGRDVLARVRYGARDSLLIGIGAVAIGLLVGGTLGLLGGYYGHRIDAVVAGAFDVMLAVPALILALAFTVFFGPEVQNMVLALGIVAIPQLGRIARANTLAWSERDFVRSARAQGARNRRILVREILPNVLPAMSSIALLGVAVAIVAEGGLSLLGAGVKTGTITWGTMIVSGRADLQATPWVVLAPATAIFLTVLALNFLGDALRARFDVGEAAL